MPNGATLYLYKRIDEKGNVSDNWSYRFQVKDRRTPLRISTRKTSYAEAKRIAIEAYTEAQLRTATGRPIRKVSFNELCDDYLGTMARGTTRDYYRETMKRFLKPFFGGRLKDVGGLRQRDIVEYEQWRRTYWTSGPGQQTKQISYQRNGKTITSRVPKRGVPSPNTWNREAVVIRALIQSAVDRELLPSDKKPVVKSKKTQSIRRPAFSNAEYRKLRETLDKKIRREQRSDYRENLELLRGSRPIVGGNWFWRNSRHSRSCTHAARSRGWLAGA